MKRAWVPTAGHTTGPLTGDGSADLVVGRVQLQQQQNPLGIWRAISQKIVMNGMQHCQQQEPLRRTTHKTTTMTMKFPAYPKQWHAHLRSNFQCT